MVKYLTERIKDELQDAHNYAEKALSCKKDNYYLSKALMKISDSELEHASILMKQLTNLKYDNEDANSLNTVLKDFSNTMADLSAMRKIYRT